MPKLTTTAEIGAFLASESKQEARESLGFDSSPTIVANEAARKALSEYEVGATRVIQENLPTIVWSLIGDDIEDDDSWIGQPFTSNPEGTVLVNLELADVSETVVADNVLGAVDGELRLGDGVTEGGRPLGVGTVEVSVSGAYVLTAPTGSFPVGSKKIYHIKSSGGGDLTLSGVNIPSDSLVSFPKALEADKTYITQIVYVNSGWGLGTLIGGY